MNIRTVCTALVAVACVFAQPRFVATQSPAGESYVITDLGTLGGTESRALGVSARGTQTVGAAQRPDGSTHAFVSDGKTLVDLGTLGGASSAATDINAAGAVVGRARSSAGNNKAFLYTKTTGMRSLGTLGGSQSEAFANNDVGDVVGTSDTAANAATRAFIYRNGVMAPLGGTFGGTSSAATAINDYGETAGWASTTGNTSVHAFWLTGGVMQDLGTLGTASQALGLNDIGEVVGRSTLISGAQHAFLYSAGTMLDLGTLGGAGSEAAAINNFSAVVGTSDVAAGGTHAFLYRGGSMADLNARLPAGSGWVLEAATAINDSGEIAGWGTINGQKHAFRLTPRVALVVDPFGALTNQDSNVPRFGVQVGRTVTFVTSVQVASDEGTARNVVLTDTMSGPIEIQRIRLYRDSGTCTVAARTVTCNIPVLGAAAAFEEEVWVDVRVTGPGAFSHVAHASADNAIPNSSRDTVREDNIGIALAAFTLSATSVAGGKAVSAKGTLTALAPPGGAVVSITSSNPAVAPVPARLVVQQPTDTRAFNVIPAVVSQPTRVTISATYGLVTISQTLTVLPPVLSTVSLTRSTIIGSCQTAIAKVTLTGSAPAAGASVSLGATVAGVNSPRSVTVPAGATSASLTIATGAVSTINAGTFTASYGGVSKALNVAVRPIYVQTLALTPTSIVGGGTVSGIVTIECAAPAGGLAVRLSSTNAAVAAPATSAVVLPAGATKGTFSVRTTRPAAVTTVTIKGSVHAVTRNAALTVTRN
jgi:probable HAF family extracellular repeat protein